MVQAGGTEHGFHVPYKVAHVPGKGWGLVLQAQVKKGQVVWTFQAEGETHVIHTEESVRSKLETLAHLAQRRFFLNHIFGWEDKMIELVGDCKFMNHSSKPVIRVEDDGRTWVAVRDLAAGEEIVDDYGTFYSPQWYIDLCNENDVESAQEVADRYY